MGRSFLVLLLLSLTLLAASITPALASSAGRFIPVSPARVLDTRSGLGAPAAPLGAGQTLNLLIAGSGGVPSVGATAVVLNVTATNATGAGYLTVWPAGLSRPVTSNLNFGAGQTAANLVEVGLGANGSVSIYALVTTHVVADVAGWVNSDVTGADGRFNPLPPARVLDTRLASGLASGGTISLTVLGLGGVPAQGVSAVVFNLTATNTINDGFLTVWPHGSPLPVASNLNFRSGETRANRVAVKVGLGGAVDIYEFGGFADVVLDVSGWFTDPSTSSGAPYSGLTPSRIMDTRLSGGPVGPGGFRTVQVAGQGGVPGMGAPGSPNAVVANVTATDTTAGSYLTVWPDGLARPVASDLNWSGGQTVPNLVVVGLGPSGAIDVFNGAGSTNFIVDVVGYYTGPPLAVPAPGSVMQNLINQDRAAAGLAPLQWSTCLANIAQNESARQAAAGAISHANGVYLDLGCGFTTAGENVGFTSGGINDDQLNTLFMNSAPHRANILDPSFRFVGTAWVVASNGYGYITEEFAG